MRENYNVSENSLNMTYFRAPLKIALSFFLLGSAFTLSHAQNLRAAENPLALAKLSYNEQYNQAALKMTPSPVIKTTSKGVPALNGVYTVGVGGNFTTLSAAVASFNASPITGPVTFSLLDSTYPSETFPIVINANAGSSATNTLTIKPAAGVDATIAGSAPVLLKINGADYVTVDGSNNGSGSDNLVLNNTDPNGADLPVIAWVASTATDGADYVTLKNIKFLGQTPSGTIAGVLVSGPTLGSAGTIPNNYLKVESNTFNRAQNAMFVIGFATNQDDGAVIKDNTIGSSNPLESMGFRGIAVQNAKNVMISGNKINGVSTSSTSTSSGILVGATINNIVVTGNQVNDVSNTNAGGYGSNGIYSNAATGSTNVLISNNFVSNVYSYGYSSLGGVGDNGLGIVIGGAGTDVRVYNNTVALNTNQTVAGRPAALNILSTVTAGAVDVRNNILANNQTTSGERYAIYSGAANTAFAKIDYNNYSSTGANIGFIGSARSNLAAVQAGFGGNVKSLNVTPVFTSGTDLHMTTANSALDNKGTPLADVTVDIDGAARSATKPDMGADEFVAPLNGAYTVGLAGDYLTLTGAVADFNALPIGGPVSFSLLDSTYPSETFPIVINANAGSSATNTLTIKPAAGVDATITGSAPVLLKINGADYVTVDGSNNGTSTDNLTLNNIDATAADNPTMLWVASTATDGADHVTLKNIKFLGLTPSGTIAGLLVSGPTLGAAGTIPNNFLKVESNTFNRSQNAMFVVGLATNQDDGAVIKDNTIGSSDPLERMGFRGIAVQNAKNVMISGNKINGVSTSSTSTSSGILVGATINNIVVTGNQVNDVSNTNAGGYGSNGIYSNAATGSTNVLISNNFVSNVYSYGYPSLGGVGDNGLGIVIGGAGTDVRVYNNTVALNTNQTVAGRPAALNILSTVTAGAVDVRNNILTNNQTTSGERYAIYSGAANTAFAKIDYNNYSSTGANIGFIGSARSNLAAVQAGFGGNTNSLNVVPTFTSTTDLHLTALNNDAISNKGTVLAEVTVDIDGDARSATTPDMGADEFTAILAAVDVTKNSMKIYPNPVVDFVNINYSSKIDSVEIYNISGQKVTAKSLNASSGTMDMRNLAPGMYIIKLKAGNDVQAVKVLKK